MTACAQRVVYSRTTVVRTVPRGGAVVVHSGVSYRYVNGIYYRPYGAGFTIVRPPVGIHVTILPVGYTRVWIAGRAYFYFDGIYYIQSAPDNYVVVEKPKASSNEKGSDSLQIHPVSELPEGTIAVNIDGKRYYKVNDTYYERLAHEDGAVEYRIVNVED